MNYLENSSKIRTISHHALDKPLRIKSAWATLGCFLVFFICLRVGAQDPQRFEEEVMDLQKKYDSLWDSNRETLVFTGSSSIRLWEDLESSFPSHQVINTGFGGSHTSDLLTYLDPLVLKFRPVKVFIYEGDNDIDGKKRPKMILQETREVIRKIQALGTVSSIVIISAKPSIERWHLRSKYKRLNRKFEKLCRNEAGLEFANIWDPMLIGKKLRPELFIEDGLHMNKQGYEIWFEIIKEFVN